VKSDLALFLTDTHPSRTFLGATSSFRSLVLLSATISPSNLFLRSIGLDESSTTIHSAIAGHKFRIKTVIDSSVTTRFKMRTARMYSEIALRVAAAANSTQGGIGVFLPSYAVLDSIREPLLSEIKSAASVQQSRRTILVERPGLSNQESDEMMQAFKSNHGCVLLAVQGGRFSEGEDFPGDDMAISIVVGLPLPPPSPTMYAEYKQMETDRFDKHQAYMVLSLLPALRKAFQCAGRHVRNPGKVGMVFFMDSRFAEQKIIDLMPSWLREDLVRGRFGPDEVSTITRDFFSSSGHR
jgi:DNA excision repair protein ERCC-2